VIYLELFWTFFLIGAFTFGGGYAMLPLIQAEVTAKGWLAAETVVNFVAVSESTPGPFAVNMATYVGSEMGGVFGAFCATLGVVLPSFLIILFVARCYDKFRSSRIVKGCMSGLKPAVVGMIGTAVLSVGRTVFLAEGAIVAAVIFAIALILALKKVHPIVVICLAAVLGIAAGILGI
jgi:chromate transporter